MWKVFESVSMTSMFKEITLDQDRAETADVVVTLDASHLKQKITGFGASLTDSSAYLLKGVLSPQDYQEVMIKLFDSEQGIGLSALRNAMGASDYARDFYTYQDDIQGEFDLGVDKQFVVPSIQDALKINPKLWFMASPWSVPAWMKDSNSVNGGVLKPEYFGAFAQYFVDYIQAMDAMGISTDAITLQNEPLYMPLHYPSMYMDAAQQIDLILHHVKPALLAANLEPKILAYDHNWDTPEYPLEVLEKAGAAVDGTAWHWYGGHPSAQTQVHNAFPEKGTYFSEGSGGSWIPEFEPAFSNLMRTSIEILRNYGKTLILWNMALNEDNGPFVPGFGSSTCRGLVKVNEQTKCYELTLDYYGMAHFSKFVVAGSTQIASTQTDVIKVVSFMRPDHRKVIVLFNDDTEDHCVRIESENMSITVKAKSAYTLVESL